MYNILINEQRQFGDIPMHSVLWILGTIVAIASFFGGYNLVEKNVTKESHKRTGNNGNIWMILLGIVMMCPIAIIAVYGLTHLHIIFRWIIGSIIIIIVAWHLLPPIGDQLRRVFYKLRRNIGWMSYPVFWLGAAVAAFIIVRVAIAIIF